MKRGKKMLAKIGKLMATVGGVMTVLGICSLDSNCYQVQVYIFTLAGLCLCFIGGNLLNLFD